MSKIIIDTDIGDDIDDALAITYAVKAGLDIIGITTAFRNTKRRAKMAARLLKTLGRDDIPVCAGIDMPLKCPIKSHENDQYDKEGLLIPCQYSSDMDNESYSSQHAVDFIIEMVRKYPGEIIIVLIAPQTNMADAIQRAPDIREKIKEFIIMGGKFYGDVYPEWNIACDPEAASVVFSSGVPINAVGLDVTMQCRLEGELFERFRHRSTGASTLICKLMERWFEHYKFATPVLHDPLTVGTLLKEYVEFEIVPVIVNTCNDGYGNTCIGDGAKIQVAKTVKSTEFLKDFIATICE